MNMVFNHKALIYQLLHLSLKQYKRPGNGIVMNNSKFMKYLKKKRARGIMKNNNPHIRDGWGRKLREAMARSEL